MAMEAYDGQTSTPFERRAMLARVTERMAQAATVWGGEVEEAVEHVLGPRPAD
jgi:hypothetical protein